MQLSSETKPIGSSFVELQSVDSTNNYALAKIHEGMAYHGDCFFTHEQTMGKGQRGKIWTAEPSSNILLSIILKPQFLRVFQQFQLSACVAVAACRFISKYAGNGVTIKWPNDVYWKDKKIGGILIESIIGSEGPEINKWKWAVVGIGININQTKYPGDLPNPVSLKQITGERYDVIQLAKELCASVDWFYNNLKNDGFKPVLDQYNDLLYKKNETVKFKKDNRTFEATVKAVNLSGQLITQHGIKESFDFGQVEWML